MSNTGCSTSTTLAVSRRDADAHLATLDFVTAQNNFQMPRALRHYDLEHEARHTLAQRGASSCQPLVRCDSMSAVHTTDICVHAEWRDVSHAIATGNEMAPKLTGPAMRPLS